MMVPPSDVIAGTVHSYNNQSVRNTTALVHLLTAISQDGCKMSRLGLLTKLVVLAIMFLG